MAEYEAYKDSGFEWLGNIPVSWPIVLLSQIVTQVKNKNSDLREQNLLSLSYGRIKRKPIDTNGGLLPESFDGYNVIEANDIVLRLTDLQNDHRSLRVGLATERGIITSAYTTMRPRNSESAKYLYYLLHTFDIRKGFYGMGSGVRQGLNYDEVKKLKLPLPTIVEQEAIAAYLDRETERIDAIIAEAKASIEEYKAWKAAEIDESIKSDKGSYKKAKLRNVCSFHNGDRSKNYPSPEEFTNDGIPFAGADALNGMYVDTQAVRFISKEKYDSMGGLKIKKYDILYTLRGSTIGKNAMAMFDDGTVASSLMGIRLVNPDLCIPEYLLYWLNSYEEYWQRDTCINGSTAPNLSAEDVKSFDIYLPSVDTQHQIVSKLNKRIGAIDALVMEKELLIEDLEAYKKSLIFEVVTGKRRVIE